jgi:hypothetical protein
VKTSAKNSAENNVLPGPPPHLSGAAASSIPTAKTGALPALFLLPEIARIRQSIDYKQFYFLARFMLLPGQTITAKSSNCKNAGEEQWIPH